MTELPRLRPEPIPAIHPLPEYQAEGRVKERYEDMKAVFQVPWMGVVTMAYAHYPGFYDALWTGLIPNLADTDPFHGGGLALPVRRAARRDAGPPDTEMAGKPRNAAGGPSRPTEGRHPLPAGVVAGCLRCQHRGATCAYPAGKGWR